MDDYPNALPEFKYLSKALIELCETGEKFTNETVIVKCTALYLEWALIGEVLPEDEVEILEQKLHGASAALVFRLCAGLYDEHETGKAEELLHTMFGPLPLEAIVKALYGPNNWALE